MKQTIKASTYSVTGIRLDELGKARLSWIQTLYSSLGESVSTSIVLRRSLELMTSHLESIQANSDSQLIDTELKQLLSCGYNKHTALVDTKPWVNDGALLPFSTYINSELINRKHQNGSN